MESEKGGETKSDAVGFVDPRHQQVVGTAEDVRQHKTGVFILDVFLFLLRQQ